MRCIHRPRDKSVRGRAIVRSRVHCTGVKILNGSVRGGDIDVLSVMFRFRKGEGEEFCRFVVRDKGQSGMLDRHERGNPRSPDHLIEPRPAKCENEACLCWGVKYRWTRSIMDDGCDTRGPINHCGAFIAAR
ncbi:hypothetical protein CDAR_63991 [Caerostris darwini]|uniref:Uncharacterized protein n=1 Tax=Caerostris darwini TaxID=1538125 RepID=A0AAV4PHE2_9ARAC|nr:hypothetical protein CDAR_63991 [Caerostris darwini]